MEELFSAISTNGRWGLVVVGPEGVEFPAQGSLRHVGNVAGMTTYEFLPGDTGTWVLPAGDVKVHGGATLIARESLQSYQVASLLLLGPQAVIEQYGYKQRSSRIVAYINGEVVEIPGTVLAAMGLLQADGEIAVVEPPPPLLGAMAAAFANLKSKS